MRLNILLHSILPFAVALTGCAAEVHRLSPEEAMERVRNGEAVLVDVREEAEWKATGVVEPAVLLALSDLRADRVQWKAFLEENRDREIILYCRSGNRSGQAAALLADEGYETSNAGGLSDWIAAGMPLRQIDKTKKP